MPLRDYEDEIITPEKLRSERRRIFFGSLFRLVLMIVILVAVASAVAFFMN